MEQEQPGVEVHNKCLFSTFVEFVERALRKSMVTGSIPIKGLCIDSNAILCDVRDETPALGDLGVYRSTGAHGRGVNGCSGN